MKDGPISETEVMQAWIECGRCGDVYYEAMTVWLTSRLTKGSAESVYNVAKIYDNALEKYLDCLRTLPISTKVERDVARALAYRSCLIHDFEFLMPMIAEKQAAVYTQIPDLAETV